MRFLKVSLLVSLYGFLFVPLAACGSTSRLEGAEAGAADFSLAASPGSVNLTAGGAAQTISVTATAINGFSGDLPVGISGIPAGVTVTPSTLTLTPGVAQSLTLIATSAAKAGMAAITLTVKTDGLRHAVNLGVTVTAGGLPPANFSLTAAPGNVAITAGGAGQAVSVTAVGTNGFTGSVNVALSGLPAGVTASPSSLTLTGGAAQHFMLTASSTTKASSESISLTGTSGSLSHGTTVGLTVAAAGAPSTADFSLGVTPMSLALTAGAAGKALAVTATPLKGFTGVVTVGLSGFPAGITATPAVLKLTPGVTQNVTMTATAAEKPLTAVMTLTGKSGSLLHGVNVVLTVAAAAPAANFSLAVAPASVALTAGSAGKALAVTATAVNGFTGSVSVALSGLPAGVTASPASLTLTAGVAQSVTLTASSSAEAGSASVVLTGTSGALSHAASVALTVAAAAPAANFSLAVAPASAALTAGSAGKALAVTATAVNGFTGSVSVALRGLPAGVTAAPAALTLTPGTAANVTLTAAGSAAAGTATITFTGTSGSLSHAATAVLTVSAKTAAGVDLTTYHYDNARDGLNAKETTLTPANVNATGFGKVGFDTTDGRVDAAPLYLSAVALKGGTHDVLYVVTEHDSVYAFDAESGSQLWQASVLGANETTSDNRNCGQITPEIGITATPVIDRAYGAHGAIFVVGMSKDASGNYHHRLHALDLTTGAELSGSPTEIAATYPGTGAYSNQGVQTFAPGAYAERVGLLLMNGAIYMGWTSHCDVAPYTGWLMAYSETTLKQTAVLNVTPNSGTVSPEGGGSMWMAGAGLVGDANGNIYFLDANGSFDTTLDVNGFPSKGDYGNAFLKVTTAGGKLTVADYFNSSGTVSESEDDVDLGSGGALLLPDQTDSSGQVHQLVVGAGKDHTIYVVDSGNMGKFNASGDQIYQEMVGALPNGEWAMPAYFNGTVYYGGVNDVIKAYGVANALLQVSPASQSPEVFGYPGTTPSVSANGTTNGIVWAVQNGTTGVLYAYDATDLSNELYNSNQAAGARDSFADNKFITPVVANGHVYVGTPTGVVVFGLITP